MGSVSFTFKRFCVSDVHCGHKVGTDGVVLGAWADCTDAKNVLDIGSGSGLIALMIAQRCDALVTAVEIDSDAAADARLNVEASPWHNRIRVIESDFVSFKPDSLQDLIVSNPPFFNENLKSPDSQRAKARHEGGLNFATLIDYASSHLTPDGRLSFIYASGRSNDIIYHAEMKKLKLRRHCLLRLKASSNTIRELFEFSPTDGPVVYEELAIRNSDNRYSERFEQLTHDFYL